jgi:hypothetical protein
MVGASGRNPANVMGGYLLLQGACRCVHLLCHLLSHPARPSFIVLGLWMGLRL